MATVTEVRARMMARAASIPTRQLCEALEILDAKRDTDDAERLTRSVLIDTLCERHPEADAAFGAWANGDDVNFHNAVKAITSAARATSRR